MNNNNYNLNQNCIILLNNGNTGTYSLPHNTSIIFEIINLNMFKPKTFIVLLQQDISSHGILETYKMKLQYHSNRLDNTCHYYYYFSGILLSVIFHNIEYPTYDITLLITKKIIYKIPVGFLYYSANF